MTSDGHGNEERARDDRSRKRGDGLRGRFDRLRARLDRLPPAWTVVVAGFVLQVVVTGGSLALAVESGGGFRTSVAVVNLVILFVAGAFAVPVVLWSRRDRRRRGVAALAVLLGATVGWVGEAHTSVVLFAAALVLAGVRAGAVVGLDAADLLALDPSRFERVDDADAVGRENA